MRVDGKKGAGIPVDVAPVATQTQPAKPGRGRPSKGDKKGPSKYMLKKYGPAIADVVTKAQSTEPKTIHNVLMLDKSSSMSSYNRYRNAMEGISLNHRALGFEIAENQGLSYVLTYMLFGSRGDEDYIYKGAAYDEKTAKDINWSGRQYPSGSTALLDAIYNIGEYIKGKNAPKADKILISLFTDGEENDSRGPLAGSSTRGIAQARSSVKDSKVAAYIKDLEDNHNCTVTFVGTKGDVETAVRDFGIQSSNAMSYDGTGAGLAATMSVNSMSRSAYSKSVLANEDVSSNFYSKSLTNE